MLVIKIELWPCGDHTRAKTLATAAIVNDLSGSHTQGNYKAIFLNKGKAIWKQVILQQFPRKRLGPWDILYRILRPIVGDRNKTGDGTLTKLPLEYCQRIQQKLKSQQNYCAKSDKSSGSAC